MARVRAADDFAVIRARLQELQRERAETRAKNNHEQMVESYRKSVRRILGSLDSTGNGPFRGRG